MKEDEEDTPELVFIPDGFHGLVIGRGGQSLNQISIQTGATLFRQWGKVYISGPQEARKKAKLQIKRILVSDSVCKHCRTTFQFEIVVD